MNKRLILKTLSKLMAAESFFLLFPALISLLYGECGNALVFLIVAFLNLAVFIPFSFVKPKSDKIYAKEGFAIVALAWIMWAAVGALPFYITKTMPTYIDCFFETVSGLTTTGATVLSEISSLPKGILFWRSFTHWIGGMGVLVFVMAIVSLSENSMNLMRAEVPGPSVGKLVPRGMKTAKLLYTIYIVLTLIEVIFLLAGGMSLYDSVTHAFSTAGTGGFSTKTQSVAYYNSAYIDGVIAVFMFLFGVNFNMYYFILMKNIKAVFKDEELRFYFATVAVCTLIILLNVYHLYDNILQAFRYVFFQVSSVITTTGFVTADFTKWPMLSQVILLLLMMTGCCGGSTGGGFKLARVLILSKIFKSERKNMLNPNAVNQITMNNKPVPASVRKGVVACFIAYIAVLISSTLLISIQDIDLVTNLTAVITCVGNVGPGLGEIVGPVGNFGSLPCFTKLILSADMLLGRLEFFPLIMLFSPTLWKRKFL